MDHLLLVDPKQSRKKKFTLVATSILGTLAFCMIAGYCVMQAQQPAHAFQAAFSENILTDLFGVWKKFHQKHYESKEEEARKFKIFVENYKKIVEFNTQGHTSSVALNQFADMTEEEFRGLLLSNFHRNQFQAGETVELDVTDIPDSIDWRQLGAVTPVKNQGQCGSCWAFAAVAGLEGLNQIKNGKLLSFSEQQLVDCATNCYGCDGAETLYDALIYTANNGVELEESYPYTARDGTCKYDASKVVFKNSGHKEVTPKSVDQLKAAIAQQPVLVGVQASSLVFQFYSGGVISTLCGNNVDHAVTAVGYGPYNGKDAFIVKNSWGTSWGVSGYVYISTNPTPNNGDGVCGILGMPVYPTA